MALNPSNPFSGAPGPQSSMQSASGPSSSSVGASGPQSSAKGASGPQSSCLMAYSWQTPIANPTLSGAKTPLKPGNIELTNKQIPAAWFYGDNRAKLQWCGDKLVLPEDPTGTLFTLRATDYPEFAMVKRNGKTSWTTSKGQGTISLEGQGPGKIQTVGGPNTTLEEGRLLFSIQMDTQLPSVMVHYKRRTEKRQDRNDKHRSHRVLLHGNTAMQDAVYHSPASFKAGGAGLPTVPAEHKEAAKEGRLCALTIHFGVTKPSERFMNCITVLHDQQGPNDFDRWTSNSDMITTLQSDEELTGFDLALRRMFRHANMKMTLFRNIDAADLHCLEKFNPQYRFWEQVMKLAIEHGPFWFYRMQPRFSPGQPGAYFMLHEKPLAPPAVPFWTVSKFRATVTADEGLTALTPLEWEPVVRDPTSIDSSEWRLPNPDLTALLQELNLLREKAYEAMAGTILFGNQRQHPTTIRQLSKVGNRMFYRIDITVVAGIEEGTQSPQGAKILPESGATISVIFRFGTEGSVTFQGRVVDELNKAQNVDLVLHSDLPVSAVDQLTSHVKDKKIEGFGVLTVKNNFISIDRMLAGFRKMTGVDRDVKKTLEEMGPHPDAQHILLGYNARYPGSIKGFPNARDTLAKYAAANIDPKADFGALCGWFGFPGLNASQKDSIISAISGGDLGNLTVIHGPSGTGKSSTLACLVVVLHFVFKSKIAVTAPSSTAANAIMEKILEAYHNVIQPRGLTWQLVRFLTVAGTPVGTDTTQSIGPARLVEDTTGLDEIAMARRQVWQPRSQFAGYSFHEAKRHFASANRNNATLRKEKREACHTFLEMIQTAVEGALYGDRMEAFRKADEDVGRQVLMRCNVLIGTLASMGRKEVSGGMPIDTIIVDECAQASLGEIAIPFATFAGTARRAVLSGDDLQLSASMASERANETAPFTGLPVFRRIRKATDMFKVQMLDVQYRCHPHIYRWANEAFYEGKVRSDAGTSRISDLDVTVAAFMQEQIGHVRGQTGRVKWNPQNWPRVIAIDMNFESRSYPGSASQHNPREVEFVAWLHGALLKAAVPHGGRALTPADITMISPYRGQVAALEDEITDERLVSTIAGSQGGECAIGISSFASNDPEDLVKIGILGNQPNLNVWFTRQQRFHFIAGNWIARHAGRVELVRAKRDHKTYTTLLEHVCGGRAEGAIVLQPRDFKGWVGFSDSLGRASSLWEHRRSGGRGGGTPARDTARQGPASESDGVRQMQQEMHMLDLMQQGMGGNTWNGPAGPGEVESGWPALPAVRGRGGGVGRGGRGGAGRGTVQ